MRTVRCIVILLLAAIVPLTAACDRPAPESSSVPEPAESSAGPVKELTESELRDRIEGSWAAQMIGVTRQTIGLIESGDFNPSIRLCVAICKALHTTLNDLFWEEEAHGKNAL